MIYDTNGNELAVSVTCYTIWARPADVRSGDTEAEKNENVEKVSKTLAEVLEMDYDDVKEAVTKEQSVIKIKKGIDKDHADKIREAELSGSRDRRRHQEELSTRRFCIAYTRISDR